jgi:2,5-dioxopentanoate dehydrogenase
MATQPVLIAGAWRPADSSGNFQSENPRTKELLPELYPVSTWKDCDAALTAAIGAFEELQKLPREKIAAFLENFADRIDGAKQELAELGNLETALPVAPRLADVELPRTSGQLRQAAAACREGSWAMATIDTKAGIRSCYGAIGPVCVFGPNNFPLAFNSAAGGDFAAAIAAGNPVIAKANSSHPGITRRLSELAFEAVKATGLPLATVQLIYRTGHADGEKLVSDPRVGATGYTGSRSAGLKLKAAADAAGKPIYLELSSTNPVIFLPGALIERGAKLAEEFAGSCLMGTGQFCTNPGLILLVAGEETDAFIAAVTERFGAAPVGTLLSKAVEKSLGENISALRKAGAEVLVGDSAGGGAGYSRANTLLRVSGKQFLADAESLQTEAFGNASLLVVAKDVDEVRQVIEHLEGNLTGCIYSDTAGSDDSLYHLLAPKLRQRVGRLLNDKMPTGVAVSPAMNHGGPYPSTGHPGFTAVGIPASLIRFAMLQCYDNVRPNRLPDALKGKNPTGRMWRFIDGQWSVQDLA